MDEIHSMAELVAREQRRPEELSLQVWINIRGIGLNIVIWLVTRIYVYICT